MEKGGGSTDRSLLGPRREDRYFEPTQCPHAYVQVSGVGQKRPRHCLASIIGPVCSLIAGNAALLLCDTASALLKLQKGARAGEQRHSTTGSRLMCKQNLTASAPCAEPVIQRGSPAGAAALLEKQPCWRNGRAGAASLLQVRRKQCKEANDQIAAHF